MSTIISERRTDLRKARRKPLHYAAWIDVGNDSTPRDCMIYDISDTGARLTVADEQQIPDNFILLLSRDGGARRICKTAWRSGFNVGIKFVPNSISAKLDC